MKITHSTIDDVEVIKFSGRIIYDTEEVVKKELDQLVGGGAKKLVFDLSELMYINSSGLGLLINALKQIRANGGDVKLSNMRDELKELFKITSLDSVFNIYETEEEAINNYKNSKQK
jgi:anti-sigma B factor antagonist